MKTGITQETVLITGASSGIGRELARCFSNEAARMILVARSGAPLQALAQELGKKRKLDVRVFTSDLASPAAPGQISNYLHAAGLKVDVLVNNAGFGAQGQFADLPLQRQLDMLQVNVTALTHLTGLLIRGMMERRRGGVLNVASTAAFQAGPRMAVYYATKAYVLSFGEALAEEMAGTGVTVTTLCPGPTETNFISAAGMQNSRLFNQSAMSAEAVARIGYAAFRQGRPIAIAGLRNRFLAFAVRLVPRAMARRVAGAWNQAK